MAILFLSPACLLLAARILRVEEASLSRCVITSIVLGLVMMGYEALSTKIAIVDNELVDGSVTILLAVFILGWQLRIGFIRSIGLSVLWGVLSLGAVLLLAMVLGLSFPNWIDQMVGNVDTGLSEKNEPEFSKQYQLHDSILTDD